MNLSDCRFSICNPVWDLAFSILFCFPCFVLLVHGSVLGLLWQGAQEGSGGSAVIIFIARLG